MEADHLIPWQISMAMHRGDGLEGGAACVHGRQKAKQAPAIRAESIPAVSLVTEAAGRTKPPSGRTLETPKLRLSGSPSESDLNMAITGNSSALVLLITVGHAIISEVKNDACVNLIFCTLKSDKNYCQFYRGSEFVLEVDRDRWNIADEQRNRSTITEYGGYGCATFRNLQESDIGDYKLHIAKEDGLLLLRQNFLLTESVLDNLLNASNFNGSKSRIGERLLVPVYWRRNDTELPEALGLTAGNGTILKDFSLALVVTAQDPAKEKPMGVTRPTGATLPPGNNKNIYKIFIVLSVLGVIFLAIIVKCYFTRKTGDVVVTQQVERRGDSRTAESII